MIRAALSLSFAAGLALAAAVPASASVDPETARAPSQTVMICGEDSATRATFEREYGERPVFVSAQDLLAARDAGERWEALRRELPCFVLLALLALEALARFLVPGRGPWGPRQRSQVAQRAGSSGTPKWRRMTRRRHSRERA